MEKIEMLNKVQEIFVNVLDDANLVITESTSSGDIDEWDSLNHIYLVVAIEKEFKVKFTALQIQSWENVGEMLQDIAKMG